MESARNEEGAASPGPIRVSANGRYFVGRDGQPFFWLGDTSYLAGGYHTYGNTNTWNFGAFPNEATQDWRLALNSPGASHLTILRRLFASIPWWTLVPDPAIFSDGSGSGTTLNAAVRSTDGDRLIAYLSSPSRVSIRMDRITAGARVTARWFRPTSGEESLIGSFSCSGTRPFSTPEGWEDALLLLEV